MKANYSGQIELTKLKSVILEKKGQTGMVRGIFIPIEQNILDEFLPGRIGLPISIVVHDEKDRYDNDGFIGQKVSTEVYKSASDEQKEAFKALPILGNIRSFAKTDNTPPAQTVDDSTDLPF